MAAKDLGPLDWKAPIVDSQGRPSPEFQRRWNLQRINNALIGTITFGVGAPTGTPADGAEYVNTATTPYSVYLGNGGAWHHAGVVVFTDLGDTPHTYAGEALALVRVKSTVDGLEFVTQSAQLDTLGAPASGQLLQRGATTWALVTLSAVLDGISSTRGTVLYRGAVGWSALAPGAAGNVLSTGGVGADPSWIPPGGGGGGVSPDIAPWVTTPALPGFDPLFIGDNLVPDVTLSSSNKVATPHSAAKSNWMFGTPARYTGKRYLEWIAGPNSLGFAGALGHNKAANTGGVNFGNCQGTVAVNPAGNIIVDQFGFNTGSYALATVVSGFATGNRVSFAADLDAGLFWVRTGAGNWNNSVTANPATGVGGIDLSWAWAGSPSRLLWPGCNNVSTGPVSLFLLAVDFTQVVPTGYVAWAT